MATQAQAIAEVAKTLDQEFNSLVNLMDDIADDGKINGGSDLGNGTTGYEIGGQTIQTGYNYTTTDSHGRPTTGWMPTPKDATAPGTMLPISTATTTQAVFVGQLTDVAQKATQLQKAVSQKVG